MRFFSGSRPTLSPDLHDLPHVGNMLVEKEIQKLFLRRRRNIKRYALRKKIYRYGFYQHSAPDGAAFLKRFSCGSTVDRPVGIKKGLNSFYSAEIAPAISNPAIPFASRE